MNSSLIPLFTLKELTPRLLLALKKLTPRPPLCFAKWGCKKLYFKDIPPLCEAANLYTHLSDRYLDFA